MQDQQLLTEYRRTRSQQAFAELVGRYADVVYAAARRQVKGPAVAEDVAQAVFLLLSQKTGRIGRGELLAGWLLRATWFTSRRTLTAERRREYHERGAAAMRTEATEPAWDTYSEEIDAAMAKLGAAERLAVTLRYFCGLSLREVGEQMALSEDAARKRVDRGLEKLRALLAKKVIVPSAAGLAVAMAANGSEAAPASVLAITTGQASASAVALAKGVGKMMVWKQLKIGVAAVLAIVLAVGGAVVIARQGLAQTVTESSAKPASAPAGKDLPPPAFLDAKALLAGWESTYGSMRTMSVAYTNHLASEVPPEGLTSVPLPFVKWMHVDLIRDDVRYRLQRSTTAGGLNDAASVVASSFDGHTAMSCRGDEKKGVVALGGQDADGAAAGREFIEYLYLQQYPKGMKGPLAGLAGKLQFLGLYRDLVAEGSPVRAEVMVRPRLEQVTGHWCHVLEVPANKTAKLDGIKAWIAADLGMALLKYETTMRSGDTISMEVREVAKAVGESSEMWYPRKATLTRFNRKIGTLKYELEVHRFQVKIPVTEATFRLQFPAGTRVYDTNLKLVYTAGDGSARLMVQLLPADGSATQPASAAAAARTKAGAGRD